MATSGNTAESLASNNKFTLGASQQASVKGAHTVLGADAIFAGDIKTKGDIVIAGTIEGEVSSEGKIVLAAGGSIVGTIIGLEVVIEGRLTGDACATKSLSILGSAEVKGDVTTPVIMIEPGAAFIGRCNMSERA